jgi:hypothetical protein
VSFRLDSIDRTGAIPDKLDVNKRVVKFYLSRLQKDNEFLLRLEVMDEKLGKIDEEIKSLRQSLLDRFEVSKYKILPSVFKRLDKDKMEIVRDLLDAILEERVPKEVSLKH